MARMGTNHYTKIARIVNQEAQGAQPSAKAALERVTYKLADFFGQDNPKFQRMRFLEECGF
jgi:hypothetical protein